MRSPTMTTPEKALPMFLARHRSLGPSLGHSLSRFFSVLMPSRLTPRHWGQSPELGGSGLSLSATAGRAQASRSSDRGARRRWDILGSCERAGGWEESRAGCVLYHAARAVPGASAGVTSPEGV